MQINALSQKRFQQNSTGGTRTGRSSCVGGPQYWNSQNVDASNSQYSGTHPDHSTKQFLNNFPAKQKFTKGQCAACQIFGHHVRGCCHIAKHLAIAKFAQEKPKICQKILRNHIAVNTEEQKKVFVRSMQSVGIFDEDEDSDDFLDAAEVIHSPVVHKIDIDTITLTDQDK